MRKTIIQNKLLFPEILWERPVHFYKAKAGKVLILAGSKGRTAEAMLASEAVFRSGTGILTLGFPDGIKDYYKDILPEAMTLALPSTLSDSLAKNGHDEIIEQSKSCDVALIGPGLSANAETVQLVWDLIFDLDVPIVLDADALDALATGIEVMRKKESEEFMNYFFRKVKKLLVITPSPGEAHRILKAIDHKDSTSRQITNEYIEKHKSKAAEIISGSLGCVTIIKGSGATLVSADYTIINKSGENNLKLAATDNVLAGIVASFIAQNPGKILEASATAIYLQEIAVAIATKESGERLIGESDVIRYLPEAIKMAELKNLNHGED